jgi:hypothetical protein
MLLPHTIKKIKIKNHAKKQTKNEKIPSQSNRQYPS